MLGGAGFLFSMSVTGVSTLKVLMLPQSFEQYSTRHQIRIALLHVMLKSKNNGVVSHGSPDEVIKRMRKLHPYQAVKAIKKAPSKRHISSQLGQVRAEIFESLGLSMPIANGRLTHEQKAEMVKQLSGSQKQIQGLLKRYDVAVAA